MSITSYPNKVQIDVDGNAISFPETATSAFGRLRVSNPFTLFDSSHRYADNDLWAEDTTGSGSSTFDADVGCIDMDLTTASGDEVIRETFRVLGYQPGKSLLIMSAFNMGAAKANLRVRIGYFGAENGIFTERDGTTLYITKRSKITGSVVDTRVAQSSWNVDKLDGTGPSGYTIDSSKVQIFWTDIEWPSTVRTGFIINGEFIICHTFNHVNLIETTYMTTGSLPLRYEATNTGTTASSSKLRQISSTVISEGGYELSGRQQAIGTPITSSYTLGSAGTLKPVVSLRLKAARRDAIAVLTAASVVGVDTGVYNWQIVARANTTGGSWVSAGANSSVEYNLTGTATSGGRILASGYFSSTNQSDSNVNLLREALFKFQFERDALAGESYEISLVMTSNGSSDDVFASLDWDEVTR